jgi:hypothetical protein
MKIFLVDVSVNRGQREALIEENYQCLLFSYAYQRQLLEAPECYFPTIFNHFALTTTPINLVIDSGAFTVKSRGATIRVEEYAAWALNFEVEWRAKLASLYFMNLDVIGDQEKSWVNQDILEALGMQPIPIFTCGADFKHLDRALENYDYIALGGLFNKRTLRSWLDACFSRVMAYRKKTGVMRRIHLLGVTHDWALFRYPCYSTDASTWLNCFRWGRAKEAGLKKLPFYDQSSTYRTVAVHVLRANIKKTARLSAEATALWRSRGIYWDKTP